MTKKTIVSIISLVSVLLIGFFVIAIADIKTVKYKRRGKVVEITGEVIKTDTGVDVKGKLRTIAIPTSDIVSIEAPVTTSSADQYKKKLSETDLADSDALLALGEWAMSQKMYKEAMGHIQAALKIDPKHLRAKLQLRKVTKLMDEGSSNVGGNDAKHKFKKEWLVDIEDVYRIRREELIEADRNIAIELRNKLADRFVKAWAGKGDFGEKNFERRFKSWSRMAQVQYMLKMEDSNSALRDDIIVKSDPIFMKGFIRDVWPTVSTSCASSKCHGGEKPVGGLKFFPFKGRNTNVQYTNYILLDGIQTHKKEPLLNRGNPDDSALLQYLLPRSIQSIKHPIDIKPVFTDRNDKSYIKMLSWIKALKHFPKHPEYNLKYKPPFNMKLIFGIPSPIFKDPKPKKEEPEIEFKTQGKNQGK